VGPSPPLRTTHLYALTIKNYEMFL